MLIQGQKVYALVEKKLRGQATPIEILHLEEWASSDTNNRSWLHKVDNPDWLKAKLQEDREIQDNIHRLVEDFRCRLSEYEANELVLQKIWRKTWMAYNRFRVVLKRLRTKK